MDNNTNNNNNNIVDDDTNMDLDLNQEPSNNSGLGTLLDELETAHDQIEERIRRLEAVTARARQRQTWRLLHNRPHNETLIQTIPNEIKSGKRDNSHLISDEGGGGFFDCNICLDTAREPILTCCGHLFCWPCFFRLPCVANSVVRECPVCKGEVAEVGVTPIYGNGKAGGSAAEHGVVVPPRPPARRVEGVRQRQRRVNRSATHVPVAEALRRIRMGISGEDRAQRRSFDLSGRWRLRTHQFSNVLPDGASSLYSISSALDNAERLVDDLESFVNGSIPRNTRTSDSNASSSVVREDVAPSTDDVVLENPVSRELRRRRRMG